MNRYSKYKREKTFLLKECSRCGSQKTEDRFPARSLVCTVCKVRRDRKRTGNLIEADSEYVRRRRLAEEIEFNRKDEFQLD